MYTERVSKSSKYPLLLVRVRVIYIYIHNLVGGFNPSEKYESQMGVLFPTEWEKKTCSKPPTSNVYTTSMEIERQANQQCILNNSFRLYVLGTHIYLANYTH